MMKIQFVHVAALLLAVGSAAAQPQKKEVAEQKPIRVLIVTGTDWKGHMWKETGPALRGILEADPRVDARLAEDPGFLAADAIFGFQAIALMFKNYGPVPQEEKVRANLLRFVEGGGGLAVVHYGSGAFEDWPEYREIIGRAQQKRHDPRGPFGVKIVDREHPVTAGMADFETDDELFFELQGDASIRVLAQAHSKVTGQDHPMAFVLQRGKGRVFHTTLGHDAKAIEIPGAAELIRRGVIWAAVGDKPAPAAAR